LRGHAGVDGRATGSLVPLAAFHVLAIRQRNGYRVFEEVEDWFPIATRALHNHARALFIGRQRHKAWRSAWNVPNFRVSAFGSPSAGRGQQAYRQKGLAAIDAGATFDHCWDHERSPSVEGCRRFWLEFLPRPQLAPFGGPCTPAESVFFTVFPMWLSTACLRHQLVSIFGKPRRKRSGPAIFMPEGAHSLIAVFFERR